MFVWHVLREHGKNHINRQYFESENRSGAKLALSKERLHFTKDILGVSLFWMIEMRTTHLSMSHDSWQWSRRSHIQWWSILSSSCVWDLVECSLIKYWPLGDNLGIQGFQNVTAQESVGHPSTPNSRKLLTSRPEFAKIIACRRGQGKTEEMVRPIFPIQTIPWLFSLQMLQWDGSIFPFPPSIVNCLESFFASCYRKTMSQRLKATSIALRDARRR